MAELASVYPTAGGPYHWTSILAPQRYKRILVRRHPSSDSYHCPGLQHLDGVPFVGKLPFNGRAHQWVSAAYQGIGMVRTFRSAQMLALLILSKEVSEEYPRSNVAVREAPEALQCGGE